MFLSQKIILRSQMVSSTQNYDVFYRESRVGHQWNYFTIASTRINLNSCIKKDFSTEVIESLIV